MMYVQKYLKENGLQSLIDNFNIDVREYPDRIVLNYSQIDSPRFNPICDECRALILRQNTWEIMARSFDRFYNFGEGVSEKDKSVQRVSSFDEPNIIEFNISEAIGQQKLDGSIMSVYFDGSIWCVSTRKMAFAEGPTECGRTFAEIFWKVANEYRLIQKLDQADMYKYTIVFELTGPENRIVTPYDKPDITIIGGRYNGDESRELTSAELDNLGVIWGINRPDIYPIKSMPEIIEKVNSLPSMEEGMVLVIENTEKKHFSTIMK